MTTDTLPAGDDVHLRARIDRSLRFPLLFFFTSAAGWLCLSSLLGFVSALSLNVPEWFDRLPALHYGRLYPVHVNALIYGWAMQAGFGVSLWLMARLSRNVLRNPVTLVVAGHVWNLVVSVGLLSILLGWGTSMPWLDFHRGISPVLVISYVSIVIWIVGMFASRAEKSAFVSQLYILASVFWFPWIYVTANGFIHQDDGAAVMKAAVNSWYISNMIYMVLAPVALAASYYIVPKVTGRPVFSYALANIGFWSLVLFTGWTGMSRYMGGPLPAWLPTVGGAASIFLLIPALAVVYNQVKTMEGKLAWANYSPALRFAFFGSIAFLVGVALNAIVSTFPIGRTLQLTQAQGGIDLVAVYGFFTMTMFGAIYFIVPRIVGCEWPNGPMIRFHFWFSAYGIGAIAAFMIFAGLAQGHVIANYTEEFITAVERGKPYLAALAIGWFLIGLSNLSFVAQLALMVIRRGRRDDEGPTLIHKKPEDYFTHELVTEKAAQA
ncbi:MAG: cbb3-type cytochrome c oxidase subunit I [Verrucomicrobia bacterium]|nr:cbb3-type cytochrome c oxidase subunit I [Verrucomicrobiota bacterium]